MKKWILFFYFAVTSMQAFAVENLKGCALNFSRLFKSGKTYFIDEKNPITLRDDQILVDGALLMHYEQGLSRVYWGVYEKGTDHLVEDPYSRFFDLKDGDLLYILNDKGRVMQSGYFKESVTKHADEIVVQPELYLDDQFKVLALTPAKLAKLFAKNVRAVAIETVTERQRDGIEAHWLPNIAAFERHQQDPSKILQIGKSRMRVLKHFEQALYGEVALEYLQTPADDHTIYAITLLTPDGDFVPLRYGDYVYLLDKNETVLDEGRYSSDFGISELRRANFHKLSIEEYSEVRKKFLRSLAATHRATVIVSKMRRFPVGE